MEESIQRDEKGDMIFPDLGTDFNREFREMRQTHVFHFKDEYGDFTRVDYEREMDQEDKPGTDQYKLKLVTHALFHTELPASDDYLKQRAMYDRLLEKFLRPVFAVQNMERAFGMRIEFFKLVAEEKELIRMKNFIHEYGLSKHEDFLLYLIAKIEQIYIRDIAYEDLPETRKRRMQLPKEVENLIRVLKYAEPLRMQSDGADVPELDKVTFQYRTTASIKIADPMLISTLLDGAKAYIGNGNPEGWEKRFRNFAVPLHDNEVSGEFRRRICEALHLLFRGMNAFDYGNKETTDQEMFVIGGMLDFAHVKFSGRQGEYDFDISKNEIKQHVRKAIERKEKVDLPTVFSGQRLGTDLNRLKQFFDPEFIAYPSPFYGEYDMAVLGSILYEQDMQQLLPDLIHVLESLKERAFQIGHEFSAPLNTGLEENKDYSAWKVLLNSIPVTHLRISFNSGGKEYETKEALSAHLLQDAINGLITSQRFEFEVDFYESKLIVNSSSKAFKLEPTGQLHQPYNRFFPRFTRQCYQFLLHSAPPGPKDYKPSVKYYHIIGQLLKEAGFFNDPYITDQFIGRKVEQWHQLKP